ncbi:MAG: peptidase M10 [Chitinophagaceae bacterium]
MYYYLSLRYHFIMGIIEIDHHALQIHLKSTLFLYGNALSEIIRANMEDEINTMWNEVRGIIWLNHEPYLLQFEVDVHLHQNITPTDIAANTNPQYNYFRIEDFAHGNISFVDGLGCNTGYFLSENLYINSTTAAHEYGHTLGLPHPEILDIRGQGIPGIMYPRGTIVDAIYQYDEKALPGAKGGTLYPIHRRVLQKDIDDLHIDAHIIRKNMVIGQFSSVYHAAHVPTV